eukprot:TRINITY_DN16453_c0_g1_i1.p1 TRINITY_DN16453_c0_g1~~TRINITY_DN16453_c0_g1_i1.p1  ORF type:complete len:120 (-),score=36.18 TRINITY_DN16453_c0_g1_i1:193-552(-)
MIPDAAEMTDATNAENADTLPVIADVEADVAADQDVVADLQEEEALAAAADLQEEEAAAVEAEADLLLARDHQEELAAPQQERLAEAVAEAVPQEELAALQQDLALLVETKVLVSARDH